MVDLGAAEHGYGAIMRALYHRAVTGTGARLDVSMLRSAVSWMVSPVLLSASLGERITRTGTIHPFFAPVAVFQTRDGYVYVAVGNDAQWAALAKLRAFAGLDRRTRGASPARPTRSEEYTSELQSPCNLVCRLLLEKKKKTQYACISIRLDLV